MSCGIYCFTNPVNGKKYIGQSKNLEKRYYTHKMRSQDKTSNEYYSVFHNALRKYGGIEKFHYEILEEIEPNYLNEREEYWIDYYNTLVPNGYNVRKGGQANSTNQGLKIGQVLKIIDLLKNTPLTNQEIGLLFNVSENTICGINTGYYWRQDCEYPIRKRKKKEQIQISEELLQIKNLEEYKHKPILKFRKVHNRPNRNQLLEQIYNFGFSGTAKNYNISDKTIVKWCIAYNLPTHIKDLRLLYEQENNLLPTKEEIEQKEKHKLESLPHYVYCFDKDTKKLIAEYQSIGIASRDIVVKGISQGEEKGIAAHIGKCVSGKRKTAYGFIWSNRPTLEDWSNENK